MHPAPGAAGELPRCGRRAVHDWRDLVKGHGEHVMQHEGQPLGRLQRFQHHQQRETNRVGQERFVLGVAAVRTARCPLRHMRVQRLLAA
jgi:hypothetical protein